MTMRGGPARFLKRHDLFQFASGLYVVQPVSALSTASVTVRISVASVLRNLLFKVKMKSLFNETSS